MNRVPDDLAHLLRRLPKAELHCHLDGSLRAGTMLDLAGERGRMMPVSEPATLADWMRVDDARNLEDYLARFEVTLALMQDAPALERIARELVIDAALDGVRYIEVRFCPALNTREGLTLTDVMDAVLRGIAFGERETGTIARVIVCALRGQPMPHALEMAELAIAYKTRGVVAFDLAGGEFGRPAHAHAAAFDLARANDLSLTIHAGEGDGAASIRDAVHRCAADRIGHGTRLFEDPALEAYIIDHRIALEVCPTSNVQTRVVESFATHPLARYRERGAVVTINTDNRLMSGVSLTDEYERCVRHLGYGLAELGALSLDAFDHAFLPYAERQQLRRAASADIERLCAEHPDLVANRGGGT